MKQVALLLFALFSLSLLASDQGGCDPALMAFLKALRERVRLEHNPLPPPIAKSRPSVLIMGRAIQVDFEEDGMRIKQIFTPKPEGGYQLMTWVDNEQKPTIRHAELLPRAAQEELAKQNSARNTFLKRRLQLMNISLERWQAIRDSFTKRGITEEKKDEITLAFAVARDAQMQRHVLNALKIMGYDRNSVEGWLRGAPYEPSFHNDEQRRFSEVVDALETMRQNGYETEANQLAEELIQKISSEDPQSP